MLCKVAIAAVKPCQVCKGDQRYLGGVAQFSESSLQLCCSRPASGIRVQQPPQRRPRVSRRRQQAGHAPREVAPGGGAPLGSRLRLCCRLRLGRGADRSSFSCLLCLCRSEDLREKSERCDIQLKLQSVSTALLLKLQSSLGCCCCWLLLLRIAYRQRDNAMQPHLTLRSSKLGAELGQLCQQLRVLREAAVILSSTVTAPATVT
jgi:hypothetical protein